MSGGLNLTYRRGAEPWRKLSVPRTRGNCRYPEGTPCFRLRTSRISVQARKPASLTCFDRVIAHSDNVSFILKRFLTNGARRWRSRARHQLSRGAYCLCDGGARRPGQCCRHGGLSRPIKTVIPADACLANTGIANRYVRVNKTKSLYAGLNPIAAFSYSCARGPPIL
jgi:hypothetical protein